MDQVTEHTVKCNRILRHQHHIHWSRISGTWSVPLHGHNSIHNIQPRLHILIQINKHTGKTVCTWIQCMTLGFMKSINESIAVFYSSRDAFQRMCLHFTKRNYTVFFQKFFRQNKFFCLYSFRIVYMDSLRIINNRNIQFLKIRIHSCPMDNFRSSSISAGICKRHILISFFSHQSGKHSHNRRMCDHCLINFRFL